MPAAAWALSMICRRSGSNPGSDRFQFPEQLYVRFAHRQGALVGCGVFGAMELMRTAFAGGVGVEVETVVFDPVFDHVTLGLTAGEGVGGSGGIGHEGAEFGEERFALPVIPRSGCGLRDWAGSGQIRIGQDGAGDFRGENGNGVGEGG